MSRTFWFVAMLSIAVVASPAPALAQNEALRGKTGMSVYVSIYGINDLNPAEFRLSLEQQLHDMGITVLPHADPPNFPVLNLTINVSALTQRTTIVYSDGRVESSNLPLLAYTSRLELRQLAPGRTAAMRPIEDVVIWSKATDPQTTATTAWKIPRDAMDLAIQFVNAWQQVNGSNHPPTADKPMPLPNPNVIASTYCVRTPIAFAMLRFCATARTLRPSEVFLSTSCRIANTSTMNSST